MKQTTTLVVLALSWVFTSSHTALAADVAKVLSEIEQMASSAEESGRSLGESVAEGIEKDPAAVSSALLPRLGERNLSEMQLAVYAWALGLTKDQSAVDAIMGLHQQSKSDLVRGNCLRALATIGGNRSGDFLLAALDSTSDKDMRFSILNLLGMMRYEPALPKAEALLGQDPKELYWQSILVFGKMGDTAVPLLLKRIVAEDRNVRANALNVLGLWLIPPEAAQPLQRRFWEEKDAELRNVILSALERTISDPAQVEVFFGSVVARESDAVLVKYARETLDGMKQMTADAASFAEKNRPAADAFKREYASLYGSAGKKGDYAVLGAASSAGDEPQLKALRERILQRDSDEAFYDYQRVNAVIMRNRMITAMADPKARRSQP